ncbi:MAG: alpha/beta hydrolase [Acidobacteriota bacterium]|nr:alpha/beta hydrolase [Acidobacteriota bacterium]
MRQITLVLLPGLDGTGRLFEPLIEVLPTYLNPFVISYPTDRFLGYSELSKYVLEKIPQDEPIVLLAESFSGAVAIELMASYPSNIQALILCASFVTNPAPRVFNRIGFIFNPQLFKMRPPAPIVRHFLLGQDASSDSVNTFLEVLKSVSPQVLSSRLQSVLEVDATEALRQCRVPILYLAAKRDKLVGKRSLTEIKSLAPTVEAATIDASHFLLQSRPKEAIKVIENFLCRVVRNI